MRALVLIGELALIAIAAEVMAVAVLYSWDRIISALNGSAR